MTSSSASASPPTSWSPGDPIADVRGEVCPFTFVRTKLALEAIQIGGVLRILVDHEPAVRNIPRSAVEWGQAVLGVTQLPDEAVDQLPGGTRGERPRVWAIDLCRRVR